MKTKLVCDLGGVHGVLQGLISHTDSHFGVSILSLIGTDRKILLVGKDQENGITELILVQHALKFLPSLNNTVAIVAVNNKDDTLGVLEVVPPQRSDLVLTTDIPHGERDVLVLDSLDVEAFTTNWSARSIRKGG